MVCPVFNSSSLINPGFGILTVAAQKNTCGQTIIVGRLSATIQYTFVIIRSPTPFDEVTGLGENCVF